MKAVNLLPSDLRGAGKPASAVALGDDATGRTAAFAVLGVLAFCVVALAAYVLAGNTVKNRKAELAQVQAQSAAVTAKAAALKPYADFAANEQQRVQTVKDLAASRFNWERALRGISRAVPSTVTLQTLNASISSAAGGSGGSGLRSAIAAPAVDLLGCTNGGQRQVAVLMSRLRDVAGVTRVSLSKSDKPDPAAAGATSTSSGPGCHGRAPVFDLVVFFERSMVPATLNDVKVGGSASPTTSTGAAAAANAAASTATTASNASTTTP